MTCRLKNLLIVFLAALAALSTAASAANAAANYKAENNPVYLEGVQKTNFVFKAGATVVCTKTTLTGTAASTSVPTLKLSPAYSGCTVSGQAATVTTNGCSYIYLEPGTILGESGLTIECSESKEIVIKATTAGCTIRIPTQAKLAEIDHDNEGSGSTRFLLDQYSVSGVTSVSSGGICGAAGVTNTGTISAEDNLRGFTNKEHTSQQGIWYG